MEARLARGLASSRRLSPELCVGLRVMHKALGLRTSRPSASGCGISRSQTAEKPRTNEWQQYRPRDLQNHLGPQETRPGDRAIAQAWEQPSPPAAPSSLLPGPPCVLNLFFFFLSPGHREDHPGHGGQCQLPAEEVESAAGEPAQPLQAGGARRQHREAAGVAGQLPGGPRFPQRPLCRNPCRWRREPARPSGGGGAGSRSGSVPCCCAHLSSPGRNASESRGQRTSENARGQTGGPRKRGMALYPGPLGYCDIIPELSKTTS